MKLIILILKLLLLSNIAFANDERSPDRKKIMKCYRNLLHKQKDLLSPSDINIVAQNLLKLRLGRLSTTGIFLSDALRACQNLSEEVQRNDQSHDYSTEDLVRNVDNIIKMTDEELRHQGIRSNSVIKKMIVGFLDLGEEESNGKRICNIYEVAVTPFFITLGAGAQMCRNFDGRGLLMLNLSVGSMIGDPGSISEGIDGGGMAVAVWGRNGKYEVNTRTVRTDVLYSDLFAFVAGVEEEQPSEEEYPVILKGDLKGIGVGLGNAQYHTRRFSAELIPLGVNYSYLYKLLTNYDIRGSKLGEP